ncbi:MAG: hypothetical protein HY931_01025 [Candidatus Falkowbacteria bacterium]|nr:MAG: hypothetical protein HY931_01025 [Candidatus Falkowbacteria bacterium]
MEKISLTTLAEDASDFLKKKKRRPLIIAIKVSMIIIIGLAILLFQSWLKRKGHIIHNPGLWYFLIILTTLFIAVLRIDWKIPVKIRQLEIDLLLPTFMKVKQQNLEKEKNTQENLSSHYTKLAIKAQNAANQAETNLQELQKIKDAFKKAQEID